jgi:hypothetical protein
LGGSGVATDYAHRDQQFFVHDAHSFLMMNYELPENEF